MKFNKFNLGGLIDNTEYTIREKDDRYLVMLQGRRVVSRPRVFRYVICL